MLSVAFWLRGWCSSDLFNDSKTDSYENASIVPHFFIPGISVHAQKVTLGTLLGEMEDLTRLTYLSDYKTVQYSSYDRRSTSPQFMDEFANSDGFGGEIIPGFQGVVRTPGNDGIGVYTMCDVKGPGAIVRLWTAGIAGDVRVHVDGHTVYEGAAENFFRQFPQELNRDLPDFMGSYRQCDALYFPLPFSKRLNIEWIGNIKARHFYHVEVRKYPAKTKVEGFRTEDLTRYFDKIRQTAEKLSNRNVLDRSLATTHTTDIRLKAGQENSILTIDGQKAIFGLKFKIAAGNMDEFLRKAVLRIYFDGESRPHVDSLLWVISSARLPVSTPMFRCLWLLGETVHWCAGGSCLSAKRRISAS